MSTVSGVPLSDLVARFGLEVVTAEGADLEHRMIVNPDLHQPGLQWSGISDSFQRDRLQVIGRSEVSYLRSIPVDVMWRRLEAYCRQGIPGLLIADEMEISDTALRLAQIYEVPILRTDMTTAAAISAVHSYLAYRLSPQITLHAGLVEVAGEGVLIMGASGVGKSEAALELIRRGHLLVSDDAVEVRRPLDDVLVGQAPETIRHFLEVRGIGIVNLQAMFGVASVLRTCAIGMVAWLQFASAVRPGDPLQTTRRILDVEIPQVVVPVQPGRNPAVLIEVAALHQRSTRIPSQPASRNGAA